MFRIRRRKKSSRLDVNLQDERLRFKVIVDSIDDGVVLIDKHRNIQLINPGAATICGWSIDEATGINVSNVIKLVNDKGELDIDKENVFDKVFNTGQPFRQATFLTNRSQKLIPLSLGVTPLIDHEKRVTAAIAVFRDVSLEKAQEQQRVDFISTASHEMRTPVATIEGYLELALNEKVATIDSRARSYLDKAHSSALHLGQLFQDLLTSAKAEDGRLTSHPTAIEITEFLENLVKDLSFSAAKKGLSTEFVVGSNNVVNTARDSGVKVIKPLYFVYADPDRLREVITNLYDNAVKYTEEGKVSIGLTANDQVVQFHIRDTGLGIPPEDIPHLFQKFYRIDNSATRTIGGTGLGLFICRKIVELYNGRVWVESEVGKGSVFYINLPRLRKEKAVEIQRIASESDEPKPINSLASS